MSGDIRAAKGTASQESLLPAAYPNGNANGTTVLFRRPGPAIMKPQRSQVYYKCRLYRMGRPGYAHGLCLASSGDRGGQYAMPDQLSPPSGRETRYLNQGAWNRATDAFS